MTKIIYTDEPFDALSPDQTSWVYNGFDCCLTQEIYYKLREELDDTQRRTYEFSLALQGPVLEMGTNGLLVDKKAKAETLREFEQMQDKILRQFNYICDALWKVEINPNSPKQLQFLLYDLMELPIKRKRNSTGNYTPTTDQDTLEELLIYFNAQPILRHILALRDLGKKISVLRTKPDPDGRMRTSFNIGGTVTGRLSSSTSEFGTGNNLQNVTELLRKVYIANTGYKLCNVDLEQADSRNIGALCWHFLSSLEDSDAYLNACEAGDLHTVVTKMVWPELPWGGAADRAIADGEFWRHYTYRDMSKRGGHGTNYLGQPRNMARKIGVTTQTMTDFQEKYFKAFPCIPELHRWVDKTLTDTSTLTTLFNRKRGFFGRADDARLREAVAYMGQSMTADEINNGILNLFRWGKVRILMQVHDSILFEYPTHLEAEIIPAALKLLEAPLTLRNGRRFVVPCEAKVGWNWSNYDEKHNPDGLLKWKGNDSRQRRSDPLRTFTFRDV